jgi:hypothetical protein
VECFQARCDRIGTPIKTTTLRVRSALALDVDRERRKRALLQRDDPDPHEEILLAFRIPER